MPEPDENADAYQAAREEALSWLKANWDPALSVREWWARLADSGWGSLAGPPRGSAAACRRTPQLASGPPTPRPGCCRRRRDTGMAVLGAQGMLASPDTPGGGEIQHRALSAAGSSIADGTDEIQRGIVGERVLGLPKEPRTDRDVPVKDLTIGTQRPGS